MGAGIRREPQGYCSGDPRTEVTHVQSGGSVKDRGSRSEDQVRHRRCDSSAGTRRVHRCRRPCRVNVVGDVRTIVDRRRPVQDIDTECDRAYYRHAEDVAPQRTHHHGTPSGLSHSDTGEHQDEDLLQPQSGRAYPCTPGEYRSLADDPSMNEQDSPRPGDKVQDGNVTKRVCLDPIEGTTFYCTESEYQDLQRWNRRHAQGPTQEQCTNKNQPATWDSCPLEGSRGA